MITIKVRENGSLRVEGDDVKVVDAEGAEYQILKRPFALCRCGGSANKPFCDGTHKRIGFQAPSSATAQGGTSPAPQP